MHHPLSLFPIIFSLVCLSADSGDLFGDGEAVVASDNNINSPADALGPLFNDASDSFLLAASPNDYPDVLAIDQSSEDGGDSDPSAPAALPPLLSFHDDPPGADDGPQCDFPLLATCCRGRNVRDCVWFDWDNNDYCEKVDDVLCCEQVTSEGRARNCQDVERWPGIFWNQLLDILRLPVPLPQAWPGGLPGGILSPDG